MTIVSYNCNTSETGLTQWIFSQNCGYLWPSASAIIWTNAGILIGPVGTTFSEISMKIEH